jgi:hypothetical protein
MGAVCAGALGIAGIAAAAGALSVTEYAAVSALMPLADIKAKIESGWDKIG